MEINATKSLQGAAVKLYDRKCCVCDLIRDKDQIIGAIELLDL